MLRKFTYYVPRNMLGKLGVSCYILADTFFISRARGADGLAALNLVLPFYGLIYAFGQMLAVGSATRFTIRKAEGKKDGSVYFMNAVLWAMLFSLPFMAAGLLAPEGVLRMMGGNARIVEVCRDYTRIFLVCAPFFMWNNILNAFIRNDGDPGLAMAATLASTIFNIIFDYVFMFPVGMGMAGAALATGISPIVGILVCLPHFRKPDNTISPRPAVMSLRLLGESAPVGSSAFLGELAAAITTTLFNFLLLGLAGNIAVAAYGIMANLAIIANALFDGIGQGVQPLVSEEYGKRNRENVLALLKLSVRTALLVAAFVILLIWTNTDAIIRMFNSAGDEVLAGMAHTGMRIYFTGFLFAGVNIVGAAFLAAVDSPAEAFAVSICRGVAAISIFGIVLSKLYGVTGVWLSFPAEEAFTLLLLGFMLRRAFDRPGNVPERD